MDWASGIVAYVLIWWLVLFTVLPFGNAPPSDTARGLGHATSAPARPRLWLKVAVTTSIASVLWLLVALVADDVLLGFRDWARLHAG